MSEICCGAFTVPGATDHLARYAHSPPPVTPSTWLGVPSHLPRICQIRPRNREIRPRKRPPQTAETGPNARNYRLSPRSACSGPPLVSPVLSSDGKEWHRMKGFPCDPCGIRLIGGPACRRECHRALRGRSRL